MPDMRRRTPEPPAAAPEIQLKPGMASELLHELAPLLAEEGIDVSNIDVPDLDTLQQALGRAIERRNIAMFTPVGRARELAAVAAELNDRPRKTLGWNTPAALLATALANDSHS